MSLFWATTGSLANVALIGDTSEPDVSTFAFGDPVNLTFHVHGAKAGQELALSIAIVDEHGKEVKRQNLPVSTDADGNWSADLPVPNGRLGFFRVRANLSDGTSLPALGSRSKGYLTYAIVPPPSLRRPVPEEEAYFGMQGGFGKNWANKLQELLGIRWVLDGYNWKSNEPDHAGQFQFSEAKIQALTVPDWQTYSLPTLFFAPAWATKPGTLAYCTGALTAEGELAWDAYCRNVAKSYAAAYPNRKERIYQITWEPNQPWGFKGANEDLIRIYQIAYQALHNADGKAVVAGPTRSLETDESTKLLALFKLGLGRYLDAFTVHPYFSLSPEKDGLVREIRSIVDIVRKNARSDIPFLGTEQGYSTHENPDEELEQARGLIRQNLIMKGEGFRINFSFYITDFRMGSENGYGYYYTLLNGVPWGPAKVGPKPIAPAFAALSYLLDGYRPVGTIEWLGETVRGYAFQNGEDVTLALWDFGMEPRELSIPTGKKQVEVWDWMGNKKVVRAPNGNLPLTPGLEPTYIRGVSPQIWSDKSEKLLTLHPGYLKAVSGGKADLKATVKNLGDVRLKAEIVVAPDKTIGRSSSRHPIDLSAGETCSLEVPLEIDAAGKPGNYNVMLTLERNQEVLAVAGAMIELVAAAAISEIRPLLFPGNRKGVEIKIRDQLGNGARGILSTQIMGIEGSTRDIPIEIPAGEEKCVQVNYAELTTEAAIIYLLQATFHPDNGPSISRMQGLSFLIARQVSSFSNWQRNSVVTAPDVSTVQLSKRNLIRGSQFYADNSATLHWGWDDQALYLTVDVSDLKHVQPYAGVDTWRGDSLQLAFDLDPRKEEKETGNQFADMAGKRRYTEWSVALTGKGKEICRHLSFDTDRLPTGLVGGNKIQLAISPSPGRLIYDVKIPWSELGAASPPSVGDLIGVAVVVNDSNGQDQKEPSSLGLFGGIVPKKDPRRFGLLLLGSDK